MHTALGRSPVEVQRCPLDSRGPRLRSNGGHWTREVPVPAVPTDIGRWLLRSSAHWDPELAVEVQQCPQRSGAGEEARRRGGEGEGDGGRRGELS